jgi:copper homeostasis protein
MFYKLEICSFNLQSALIAQQAGAHRVELCADPADGGTTQSLGVIKKAREKLHIELYPIIRPRGGDFLYSDEEFEIMLNDVTLCKQIGCNGVVIGMLQQNGIIDKIKCAKLTALAYPLGVTFHRAFDWALNPQQTLEDIIDIGCERILSSGQKPTAPQGALLLKELITQANGRIQIMPGSGIRASNIIDVAAQTGAEEFHSSARIFLQSDMEYKNENMCVELKTVMADQHEIEQIVHLLNTYQHNSS